MILFEKGYVGGCKGFVRMGGVEWCGGVEMKMK